MTLDQYLTETGETAAQFGERVQLSEASISRIRQGAQNITRDVMRRIIAASDGRITAESLVHFVHDDTDTTGMPGLSAGNDGENSRQAVANA